MQKTEVRAPRKANRKGGRPEVRVIHKLVQPCQLQPGFNINMGQFRPFGLIAKQLLKSFLNA